MVIPLCLLQGSITIIGFMVGIVPWQRLRERRRAESFGVSKFVCCKKWLLFCRFCQKCFLVCFDHYPHALYFSARLWGYWCKVLVRVKRNGLNVTESAPKQPRSYHMKVTWHAPFAGARNGRTVRKRVSHQ